jgi:hypothetical protein
MRPYCTITDEERVEADEYLVEEPGCSVRHYVRPYGLT